MAKMDTFVDNFAAAISSSWSTTSGVAASSGAVRCDHTAVANNYVGLTTVSTYDLTSSYA